MQRTSAFIEMPRRLWHAVAIWGIAASLLVLQVDGTCADDATPSGGDAGMVPRFERDILPILARHCHDCHGADAQEAQFDARTLSMLVRGGENGPALVPGQPKRSLLFDLLARGEMPPEGEEKPSADELVLIRRWIEAGTPADEQFQSLPPLTSVRAEDRQHWAFRAPVQRPVPTIRARDRVRSPVDAFLLSTLEAKGLAFSSEADRSTLLRRASFDLIGLPPTPAEVADFRHDARPDAYERLIDRLLASRHYGERWGRHWLDAAGYVDNRLFDGDLSTIYPNEGIWRYRDYVVRAHNADKPWDRFLAEQLAGDELVDWRKAETFTSEVRESLIATGYLRSIEDPTSEPQYGIAKRYEVMFDLMSMVSTSLLGLTMECARCHNHKYDPLPQRDYYRLLAVFEGAFHVHHWKKPQDHWLADVAPIERTAIDAHNAEVDKQIKGLNEQLAASKKANDADKQKELGAEVARLAATKRGYGKIQATWDVATPEPSHVLRRGAVHARGVLVQPGFPTVLGSPEATESRRPTAAQGATSGRRLAFAQWLTRRDHPLTARVIVNRVWHHHFGRGIVATPGNFGRSGIAPSHPELLDWLAVDFIEHGWSLKELHRRIMLSSAYRQSSRRPARETRAERIDPENRLLWRMNLRRLEAESVRDAMLAASGQLDPTTGGPPILLTTPIDGLSEPKSDVPSGPRRRSLYLFARRVYPLKFLEVFDAPIMPVNCTERMQSATVLQSFAALNSPFAIEQARRLAERVRTETSAEHGRRFEQVVLLALNRPATSAERESFGGFLKDQVGHYADAGLAPSDAEASALADLCRMLLASNEFLYVE